MKKAALFFFGIFFLACGEKVVEQPESLIPKDKMTNILYDLALLNSTQAAFSSTFDETGIDIMEFLYKKYNIDSTQFAQSDLYYASIPLEYQSIYKDVEAMIESKKEALEKVTEERNDSIRKAQTHIKDSIQALRKDKDSVTP